MTNFTQGHQPRTHKGDEMAIDYDRESKPREKPRADGRSRGSRPVRAAVAASRVVEITNAGATIAAAQPSSIDETSSIGMAVGVAESIEEGFTKSDLDERMERFPELRDLEVASGAATRFPELDGSIPEPPQQEDEDDFGARR